MTADEESFETWILAETGLNYQEWLELKIQQEREKAAARREAERVEKERHERAVEAARIEEERRVEREREAVEAARIERERRSAKRLEVLMTLATLPPKSIRPYFEIMSSMSSFDPYPAGPGSSSGQPGDEFETWREDTGTWCCRLSGWKPMTTDEVLRFNQCDEGWVSDRPESHTVIHPVSWTVLDD